MGQLDTRAHCALITSWMDSRPVATRKPMCHSNLQAPALSDVLSKAQDLCRNNPCKG